MILHRLSTWQPTGRYEDITCEKSAGIARIRVDRPRLRPQSALELFEALSDAERDPQVGVVLLASPDLEAFCLGDGPRTDEAADVHNAATVQRRILEMETPTVASVAGFVLGGGLGVQIACDLTVAADNAIFGLTPPHAGDWDPGVSALVASELTRAVGHKRAREMQLLCRQYGAKEALSMGLVNAVVHRSALDQETMRWCREILAHRWRGERTLPSPPSMEAHG